MWFGIMLALGTLCILWGIAGLRWPQRWGYAGSAFRKPHPSPFNRPGWEDVSGRVPGSWVRNRMTAVRIPFGVLVIVLALYRRWRFLSRRPPGWIK